jgi:hypothetical protein
MEGRATDAAVVHPVVVHALTRWRAAHPIPRPTSGPTGDPAAQPATGDSAGPRQAFAPRLEGIADAAMSLLDLSRWATSSVEADGTLIIGQAHVRRSSTDAPRAVPDPERCDACDPVDTSCHATPMESRA